MMIFNYPWWAFTLAAALLLNPVAFIGFTTTLMLLTLQWPYKDASHTAFVLGFGGFNLALLVLVTAMRIITNG